MGRSSNPRKPLPAERGAKRTGPIGTIVPGDDVEVAREIQRLWLAVQALDIVKARPVVALGGGDLVLLGTQTLSVAGELDVFGIDQGYRDLIAVVTARSISATPLLTVKVNGDGSTVYDYEWDSSEGGTPDGSYSAASLQYAEVGPLSPGTSAFTRAVVEIPRYADSQVQLMLTSLVGFNGGTSLPFSSRGSIVWATADPITQLTFTDLNGLAGANLVADSRLDVYGRGRL